MILIIIIIITTKIIITKIIIITTSELIKIIYVSESIIVTVRSVRNNKIKRITVTTE